MGFWFFALLISVLKLGFWVFYGISQTYVIKKVELEPETEILISYNDNYYTINSVKYNA